MSSGRLKWVVIGDLIVAASNGVILQDATWDAYVHDLQTKSYKKYLHIGVGGTEVTSVQRKQAFEAMTSQNARCAVLTSSGMVRGIVTAASWFGVQVKAFKIEEASAALDHLGVVGPQAEQAQAAIARLQLEVAG